MKEMIKNDWQARIAILLFILLTLWWFICPQVIGPDGERFLGDFASIYGIMALFGGLCGIQISKKWGGFKSVMGRAILMFSFGLLAQVFGQVVYAYFSFVKNIAIPYPSLGDLGYFGTIPFYIYGALLIARASGVKLSLQSFSSKLQAVIIPFVMLSVGYYLFLRNYEFDFSDPVKIFLDFGYPLGQAIYISIGILTYGLTRNMLGGIMKNKILFLIIAFSAQFLADYAFLYFQAQYTSGGIIDYMYLVSYFLMSMAILMMNTTYTKLKHE